MEQVSCVQSTLIPLGETRNSLTLLLTCEVCWSPVGEHLVQPGHRGLLLVLQPAGGGRQGRPQGLAEEVQYIASLPLSFVDTYI